LLLVANAKYPFADRVLPPPNFKENKVMPSVHTDEITATTVLRTYFDISTQHLRTNPVSEPKLRMEKNVLKRSFGHKQETARI
jgi:hypothetical protein